MENKRLPVVIDTDAYNEIDDQFAIAYLMRSDNQLETLAIYAAPFYNNRASSPADGMEKSYQEILRLMKLMGNDTVPVLRGSENYLPDEQRLSSATRRRTWPGAPWTIHRRIR